MSDEDEKLSADIAQLNKFLEASKIDVASKFRLSAFETMHAFADSSSIQKMLASTSITAELGRTLAGPLYDLQRAGVLAAESSVFSRFDAASKVMEQFNSRFRLPELSETASLFAAYSASNQFEALNKWSAETASFRQAMEKINSPWIDSLNALRSMSSFSELYAISNALASTPTYNEDLTAKLRIDLGDWRDLITWDSKILTDLFARSDFYQSRGFNQSLTDFPAKAFEQGLGLTGLSGEPPELEVLYGRPVAVLDNPEAEASLMRTNTAHDWLFRLETQLRKFIDEQMTRVFGNNWPQNRLPNGLYDEWLEKKKKSLQAGRSDWPIVAYADFTDYEKIICRKDNWREVFSVFFGRLESVRESFQRLHLVRLDTMHARPITQDDELLLYVEVRRLSKAIR